MVKAKRNPVAKALAHPSKRSQVVPDRRRRLLEKASKKESEQ